MQVEQQAPSTEQQRPESVQLMVYVWIAILIAEALHQVINVAVAIIDPSAMIAAAKQAGAQTEMLGDAAIHGVAIAAAVFSGLIGLGIVALLGWFVSLVWKAHKWAGFARRFLLIFGFYLAVRGLLMFGLTPGASHAPDAFFAIDGALQIFAAVAAVVSLIFNYREETWTWTGDKRP
ncbi:hypothetical protein [Corynebacterium renale]|uniref:DUF2127 domain-containing protein n=1 Tax=Corynebacterium renale TaxID=1724 RepID=A0A2A9DL43_9CORY|nr:hypothetical protein [Corynebacterium renale]PFG27323.1 hypothetical protein ATK06_0378 [Corynebacterium renale]SQI23591.1 hypothetical membrane protein [Corynebacterium renale]